MKWYQDTFIGKLERLEKAILEGFRKLLSVINWRRCLLLREFKECNLI